jgi:LacI family transcriptional regulator
VTLSSSRTGLVAVLVPLVHDTYFSAILGGVAEAAYEHGVRVVLSPTQHEHSRESSLLDELRDGTTDGAVIILPEESGAAFESTSADGYPVVVIDPLTLPGSGVPTVTAAHAPGAAQAMSHLLELGHRRIGAITGPSGWLATEERRRAYDAALAAAGIPPDPALVAESDFELAPGAAAAAMLIDLPEPPTAIFAFNDAIAIGALHAAHARGLQVPDDLSIVGFDDIDWATIVRPALTTVRQPLRDMGRTGVSLLLRLLEGEHAGARQIEHATRLVVRDSTAPPRT